MKRIFSAAFAACLLLSASAARADIEHWKVIEVSGPVEMKPPAAGAWQSLSAPFYLKRGSRLRTGREASVDLSLDRQWDGFLRLNEDSELEFPENAPDAVRLKKGSLFVLLDDESGELRVLTPKLTLRLDTGGAAVSAASSGTRLRVYGESARIDGVSQPVEEGWEWDNGSWRRMEFADYDDWQKWIRKTYERKDKYFRKRSE